MTFTKQFFLVLFFVKVFPVVVYPYTFDDFLYSNEEIAIAILFLLFVATIEKYFGQIFFDAFMEKKNYLRELHASFTKQKYVFLKKQKENLEGIKYISQNFPILEYMFLSESFSFSFTKKLISNEINTLYDEQFGQLAQGSKEDNIRMAPIFRKLFHEEFSNENFSDGSFNQNSFF